MMSLHKKLKVKILAFRQIFYKIFRNWRSGHVYVDIKNKSCKSYASSKLNTYLFPVN